MAHRENNFDAIRLIAAAAVIYGHAYPLAKEASPWFFANSVQSFSVKIFFIISGFLITGSWIAEPRWGRFFVKRSLRIFPALVVVVLASGLLLGPALTRLPLTEYFQHPGTRAYLRNLALFPIYALPGVFESIPYPHAVNGSLWTLPVEFGMYCCLPVVLFVCRALRGRWLLGAATLALCGASLWFVQLQGAGESRPIVYGTSLLSALEIAPFFLLGATVRWFELERYLNPTAALGLVACAVLWQPPAYLQEAVLYLVAPYAVLSFALSPLPGVKSAGRWGDFSYGLYLYGFPMQQLLQQLWPQKMSAPLNAALALGLALACAVLSWHWVEKPALRLKDVLARAPARGQPLRTGLKS